MYLRDPKSSETYIASAPNDSPLLGRHLTNPRLNEIKHEPYHGLIDELDSIEGDLDFECNALLGTLLGRFGNVEAGIYLAERIDGTAQ